ncbi:hypothetical protein ACRDNQ_05975 [Palleronia sp. KMU-117]|uniref:hypothetical protein n=1 Tax=Palleronia sp. KMU-117 TaxID=3434108 RepID=UPI003D726B67
MKRAWAAGAFRVWAGACALALSGCVGAADDIAATRALDLTGPVDATAYAGDVEFRIVESFKAGEKDVPFTVFLGLTPGTGTRLAANALVDLRPLQQALPDLLTGAFDPSCGLGLDVNFRQARAVGPAIEARATVDARLYRCHERGTETEKRGGRIITQSIDVVATIGGDLRGDCIEFRLEELDLAPRGLLGGLATLFGVTEKARAAILAQTRETLSANPVCPDLPDGLSPLDPQFSAFSLTEIGVGGIGAAGSGSVDLGAEKVLRVLASAKPAATGTDGKARVVSASQDRLEVRVDDTLGIRGREIAYGLDIGLAVAGPTRIGVATALDLRDLQAQLPDLLAGEILVETCGGGVTLDRLEIEGRGATLVARATLDVTTYDCVRTGPGTWERSALLNADAIGVRADMSTEVVENCIVFRLLDLERDPPGVFAQMDTGSGRAQAARALLLEAVGLLLEDSPLCPQLPAELAVLDPRFDRGAPQEVGEGGVGVRVDGSIEVGPQSVVDLLRLLQERKAEPPPP